MAKLGPKLLTTMLSHAIKAMKISKSNLRILRPGPNKFHRHYYQFHLLLRTRSHHLRHLLWYHLKHLCCQEMQQDGSHTQHTDRHLNTTVLL